MADRSPKPEAVSVASVARFSDYPALLERVRGGERLLLRPPGWEERPRVDPAAIPWGVDEGGGLGIWSSGSSGRPKLVWRRWRDLVRWSGERNSGSPALVWGSCYDPWSFAGALVAVHAFRYHETVWGLSGPWETVWRTVLDRRLNALSITATFLRLALLSEPAAGASWRPRQMTLGGEVASGAILRQVAERFPECRVSVVYASAEGGVLAKCRDGSGWFPTADLERDGRRFAVRDGRLFLRDAGGAEWDTGDRVELDGARFRPLGRVGRVVNVGGTKVALDDVERALESQPGVRSAVAWTQPNPVVGQVVAARVEWGGGEASADARERLQVSVRERLPKAGWPRHWEFGPIALGPNGKRFQRVEWAG